MISPFEVGIFNLKKNPEVISNDFDHHL